MSCDPSWRGWIVVPFCVVVPIPAAILAFWLVPEKEKMGNGLDFFILFGAFPIGWTFSGIGCWVLGQIWNRDRTDDTFLHLAVEYWGLILFSIGFGLSLIGLWGMYQNGLFAL